jgi:aminotransferase
MTRREKSVISETVRDIAPSGIRKFFDLVSEMDDVVSLGVGEPDFVTPWHIREAAIYSLERGQTMYTSNYGHKTLRQAIAQDLSELYGVEYDPLKEILVTVGVSEAFDLAFRAIVNPGDEIVIHEPCYVSYVPCALLAGAVPVRIVTRQEDGFKVTPDLLRSAITSRTKAVILSYPNNPTGATMTRKDLEEIAAIAEENDLLVISDEIYAHLTYEGEHTCFSSLKGMRDRTILFNGFSKAYAMTGWRIGYAAGPSDIIGAMVKIHQYTMLCAPIMAQNAALEALQHGKSDREYMVEEYNRRRRFIVRSFKEIGFNCFEPKGAFYVFPCIQHTGMSSEEFAEKLLMEEKVAVVPGNAFGECGEGFIRCSYATSFDSIKEAVERIKRFVQKHF